MTRAPLELRSAFDPPPQSPAANCAWQSGGNWDRSPCAAVLAAAEAFRQRGCGGGGDGVAGMAFLRSLWKAMDRHSTAPYIGRSRRPVCSSAAAAGYPVLGFRLLGGG